MSSMSRLVYLPPFDLASTLSHAAGKTGLQMTGSDRPTLINRLSELLTSERVGVLATRFEGAPHQSLIAYVCSEDLREIYFVSPRDTRKVRAIEQDPRVSLLVDNRQNVESEFDACIAATAKGTVERLSAPNTHPCYKTYLARHPYLESFVVSPICEFFRISVLSYSLASRFESVQEVVP